MRHMGKIEEVWFGGYGLVPFRPFAWAQLDVAKRAGRVEFGLGQSGRGSKRVIFKRVNWVTGRGLSRVASQVELTRIFFFFFEVDAICQFFMSSLTIIRFSLVILLPITTKNLTWNPNLVQLLFQLSRS